MAGRKPGGDAMTPDGLIGVFGLIDRWRTMLSSLASNPPPPPLPDQRHRLRDAIKSGEGGARLDHDASALRWLQGRD